MAAVAPPPTSSGLSGRSETRSVAPASRSEVAAALASVVTCGFVAFLVCSQFFGALASAIRTPIEMSFGQHPADGPVASDNTNDAPYTDRVLACVGRGNSYQPVLVEDLLSPLGSVPSSSVVGAFDASVSAYRVVKRTGGALDSAAAAIYADTCSTIAQTLGAILQVCAELGYLPTADALRVAVGNETRLLHHALPVLLMPYWDNAPSARSAIPGWDGSACMVHLTSKYEVVTSDSAVIRGVNRTVREAKTVEWLRRPGGSWRHGWYHDREDMQWYADMMTTSATPALLPTRDRYFLADAAGATEIDCARSSQLCRDTHIANRWGPKFSVELDFKHSTSVVVNNATQFGIMWWDGYIVQTVRSTYDWPTAVANLSILLLVFRWSVSLLALLRAYRKGTSRLHHIGIGALSSAASFRLFPILLLPRLSSTLTAFFSVGCAFQGQQMALSETWFVMYPAIAELVLLYYSLLNSLAKVLRLRVSDALFAPTILALSALHFCRWQLLRSPWLDIPNHLVDTLVTSDELQQLTLAHFFSTDVALRLNGGVSQLLVIKLAVLGTSLVPWLLARPLPVRRESPGSLSGVEKALALRASNVAGLGRSSVYELQDGETNRAQAVKAASDSVLPFGARRVLSSYELIRLGCVIYGDKYLITMDDWDRVSMLAGFRHLYHLWNHRVTVFELRESSTVAGQLHVAENPRLMRVDDPELASIGFWNISARPLSV